MAQVMSVRLVDDLDGSSADETIEFAIDGKEYEIDLTSAHASKLRDVLADFVSAGRRNSNQVRRGRRLTEPGAPRPVTTADREQNQAIRAWARKQGIAVSDRGRIPQSVLNAFHQRT
ncbi:histone-like nucleoid-structuring protein Lsr2 [Pseudonocardia parietis]|uniref:Lsr2 protein n=1 Tax=Pseudonocardia parietis TaxID=570936 RepID=A0ABS4W5A1_9PSEU|nr:Lsr2 family protein [Pseudonocardia parietis]MBP2371384.1 hypothetical protein [Pseudonocardia parietis]